MLCALKCCSQERLEEPKAPLVRPCHLPGGGALAFEEIGTWPLSTTSCPSLSIFTVTSLATEPDCFLTQLRFKLYGSVHARKVQNYREMGNILSLATQLSTQTHTPLNTYTDANHTQHTNPRLWGIRYLCVVCGVRVCERRVCDECVFVRVVFIGDQIFWTRQRQHDMPDQHDDTTTTRRQRPRHADTMTRTRSYVIFCANTNHSHDPYPQTQTQAMTPSIHTRPHTETHSHPHPNIVVRSSKSTLCT